VTARENGATYRLGPEISRPSVARVYDYMLGGKDSFAADREVGEKILQGYPDVAIATRANRAFLGRAVRFLAGEAGIRQFLDVCTGIPSANNTHEAAQSMAPESRIMYMDNDPQVLAHAHGPATSDTECSFVGQVMGWH
jgi:hypothetical protein